VIELTIDLDEPGPPPVRRAPPQLGRWLAAAVGVLSVAGLLALGGSAPPDPWPSAFVRVPSQPYGGLVLGEDTLYVAWQQQDGTRVSAHRTRDGSPKWTVLLPARLDGQIDEYGPNLYAATRGSVTLALDRRTGARRWSHDGWITGFVDPAGADPVLVLSNDLGPGRDSNDSWLAGVEPDSGRERWRRPLDPMSRVYAGDTGVWVVPTDEGSRPYRLQPVTGDVVETIAPPPDADFNTIVGIPRYDSCGRLRCDPGDNGTVAVDPVTGREVWHTPWPYVGHDPDSSRLLIGSRPTRDGGPGDLGLLDPATGATVREYHNWRALQIERDVIAIVRDTPTGVAEVAALDRTTGEAVVLGRSLTTAGECAARSWYVVCPHNGRELRIWRLEPQE